MTHCCCVLIGVLDQAEEADGPALEGTGTIKLSDLDNVFPIIPGSDEDLASGISEGQVTVSGVDAATNVDAVSTLHEQLAPGSEESRGTQVKMLRSKSKSMRATMKQQMMDRIVSTPLGFNPGPQPKPLDLFSVVGPQVKPYTPNSNPLSVVGPQVSQRSPKP